MNSTVPALVLRWLNASEAAVNTDTSAAQDDKVRAPMPGRVVVVRAAPGDSVVAGQELLVIEAMKMELALKAPRDGVVASVDAEAGAFVEADTVLVSLEP